jgi:FkbH-like protein
MNFIEATKIIKEHKQGLNIQVQLSSSCNIDPLLLYIKAFSTLNGISINLLTLPFGTLGQALLNPMKTETKEILLIMPWDLIPELDWRSGIPSDITDTKSLLANAMSIANQISKRNCNLFYLPAPVPPILSNPLETISLLNKIAGLMANSDAIFLDRKYFSLGNYLASGVPFAGATIGKLANDIINGWLRPINDTYKVLITDLDNVLWSGLAAEDGPEGIVCSSEGKGFRHFLYQSFLLSLKKNGILLAAISRNDLDVAIAPIKSGITLLDENDFIDILASYEPKSLHIKRLAQKLNLGMDSFLFIDDNPLEIAEVKSAIPQIKCMEFPLHDDMIPDFFDEIADIFKRNKVSFEDIRKTEMYRQTMELNKQFTINEEGGDLKTFLQNLSMELIIFDRSKGDKERAIQLINKTNQFNLNGSRINGQEVTNFIKKGGRLLTASLTDRTGNHGEIISCLIDKSGCIHSFVLSCRVFQRQIEFAFIIKLIEIFKYNLSFIYKKTEKNTPLSDFLKDRSFTNINNHIFLDTNHFLEQHNDKMNLFKIKELGFE